jgi:hypothetical protein
MPQDALQAEEHRLDSPGYTSPFRKRVTSALIRSMAMYSTTWENGGEQSQKRYGNHMRHISKDGCCLSRLKKVRLDLMKACSISKVPSINYHILSQPSNQQPNCLHSSQSCQIKKFLKKFPPLQRHPISNHLHLLHLSYPRQSLSDTCLRHHLRRRSNRAFRDGLSGLGSFHLVIMAAWAEILAGSISVSLGRYLAAIEERK